MNGGTVNSYAYKYDAGGNRTTQRDSELALKGTFNKLNQLRTLLGGNADDEVSGSTDEAAKLTINGESLLTDEDNGFATYVESSGGTTPLSITAEDFNGNAVTKNWTFESANAVGGTFSYSGGNLASQSWPQAREYTWDGEDRLKTVIVEGTTYSFDYDAFGRRIREKVDGVATRTWVWDGLEMVEERSGDGSTVSKRFYPQGEQRVAASRFSSVLANSKWFGKGSALFGRGGQFGQKGMFNQGSFRTGWGWKGSRTGGRDVFRSSWSQPGNRTGFNHFDWF